jgi:hypothetical protein
MNLRSRCRGGKAKNPNKWARGDEVKNLWKCEYMQRED